MRRQINILTNTDWFTVILYLFLVAFGWLNIFAVNYSPDDGSFFKLEHRYTMQLLWIMICLIMILVIFLIDSRLFSFIAYPVYGFSIFLLLVVLIIGTAIHSSKSWIMLGPVSFQPSEFAKLGTALALARYLSGYNVKITQTKHVFASLAIIAFPAFLIMIQPDFGSTIVFGALLLMLYREGLPGWILIFIVLVAVLFLAILMLTQFVVLSILGGLGIVLFSVVARKPLVFIIALLIAGAFSGSYYALSYYSVFETKNIYVLLATLGFVSIVGLFYTLIKKIKGTTLIVLAFYLSIGFTYSVDYLFHNVMKEHQRNRVNVMLGLESDPYGYEYNVRQSKIAIGSGGFAGKGFLKGTQTKFRFVPEQSTDFIFCTVGEEWGFLGSFGLVLIYASLLIRLIILAERQRSGFSRIYGYGVISILFFHFAVNIGMTIGLFPVIGIPLPFLSYGGSSLLTFTLMLFIFIRLDSTRKAYLI
ncbi:MAG: rod shape-determining protein RodA [Bacteroidales bacterium]|nr:rod shape-determining protein RodA [Bacteroidales bacterium]